MSATPELCMICDDRLSKGEVDWYYKRTCSKECARTLQIKLALDWLSDRVQDLSHG